VRRVPLAATSPAASKVFVAALSTYWVGILNFNRRGSSKRGFPSVLLRRTAPQKLNYRVSKSSPIET
jgi:hypothetical protein